MKYLMVKLSEVGAGDAGGVAVVYEKHVNESCVFVDLSNLCSVPECDVK